MNGMEMMLKALGIDPEEIKKAMFGTVAAVMDGIKTLNERQSETNSRLAETNARLARLEDHLGVEQPINGREIEILPPLKRQA